MLKLEFKEPVAVLLVLAVLAIALALLGTNPLDAPNTLNAWVRLAFAVLGLALLAWTLVGFRQGGMGRTAPPPTAEYRQRFEAAQAEQAKLTPDHKILGETEIGPTKFLVLNENILQSQTDVIVSSDDNHFTATGGVARAILDRIGPTVQAELDHYRAVHFRQGELAITTGGDWKRRAIFHAAVIDLDENRYPSTETVRTLVTRCLTCALAIGARSIAFPVLGGGTASKHFEPEESVRTIAAEVVAFLEEHRTDRVSLSHVALYVLNARDAKGLPARLIGAVATA